MQQKDLNSGICIFNVYVIDNDNFNLTYSGIEITIIIVTILQNILLLFVNYASMHGANANSSNIIRNVLCKFCVPMYMHKMGCRMGLSSLWMLFDTHDQILQQKLNFPIQHLSTITLVSDGGEHVFCLSAVDFNLFIDYSNYWISLVKIVLCSFIELKYHITTIDSISSEGHCMDMIISFCQTYRILWGFIQLSLFCL